MRGVPMNRLLLSVLLLFWGAMAPAEGLLSMGSRQDGRQWEAVGRLELAGKAFCTGALIAPDIVVTAAHCLFDAETGARVPEDQIQFLAGWRNGRAAAYRRVRRAVTHPDYAYDAPSDARRVSRDLALIRLQHPIRNTTVTPFDTGPRPGTGDRVGVVSYAHDRSEAPSLQELCDVISLQDAILILSCTVDFGASGSPVFHFGEDGLARIVSVVSAKAEANGAPVSLALDLAEPLARLRAELEAQADSGAGLEPMQAGTRRDTGARFIRP